jgi:hypothetical protein
MLRSEVRFFLAPPRSPPEREGDSSFRLVFTPRGHIRAYATESTYRLDGAHFSTKMHFSRLVRFARSPRNPGALNEGLDPHRALHTVALRA